MTDITITVAAENGALAPAQSAAAALIMKSFEAPPISGLGHLRFLVAAIERLGDHYQVKMRFRADGEEPT